MDERVVEYRGVRTWSVRTGSTNALPLVLVKNEGSEIRESIRVKILLYDAENKEVDSEVRYTNLSHLAPGQSSGFSVNFLRDGRAPQFDHYRIEIESDKAGDSVASHTHALEVSEPEKLDRGVRDNLRGTVKNNSQSPLSSIEVHAVFYNAKGEVVDSIIGHAVVEKPLMPGERAPYQIMGSNDESVVKIELEAEGKQKQ